MSTQTPHYGLGKSDGNEKILRSVINGNLDIVDNELYKKRVITGTTAPTTATVGVVGQFYLNTTTGISYQCVSVVNSVFTWKAIVNEPVGTMKPFAGTNLGSDWLLCNGAGFSGESYPELASLPIFGHDFNSNIIVSQTIQAGTNGGVFNALTTGCTRINVNGYDIMTGRHYDTSNYYPTIAYAAHDSTNAFTIVRIASNASDQSFYVTDIIWDGTYYVAVAYDGATSNATTKIYYSTTLSNTAWTSYTINCGVQGYAVPKGPTPGTPAFIYKNGYYVIAMSYSSSYSAFSCYIMYSQSLTSGWTSTRLPNAANALELGGLYYINNTWVVLYFLNGYTNVYASFCTTSAPTSFSSITIINTGMAGSSIARIRNLKYIDGKWILLAGSDSSDMWFIYNTNVSFSNTGWQYFKITGLTDTVIPSDFDYDGLLWVLKGQDAGSSSVKFWISLTLTGSYSLISIQSRLSQVSNISYITTPHSAQYVNKLIYDSVLKRWMVIMSNDGSYNYVIHRYLCGSILPLVVQDKSYMFIKAK